MERVNQGLFAGASVAFLLSLGCSGTITDNGTQPGSPAGTTASGAGGTPSTSGAAPGSNASGSTPGAGMAPTSGGTTGTSGAGTNSMTGAMPPATGTAPPPGSQQTPIEVPANPPQSPGYMVVRRLNRAEYNNTVRDLLGTKLTPANDFPSDDLGAEFDTVGAALSLSPEYVVSYESAATNLITDLFADAARQKTVATCDVATAGDACAKTILSAFARRAWRRPVTADEAQALMAPVTAAKTLGATPLDGLKAALTGVLISPFFIFKLEMDPDPNAGAVRRLNPYELATRLSYALWSTMPDAALSAAADGGLLATDEQVAAQVSRMLADPRADALIDNFTAKWLDIGGPEAHDVDLTIYPKYTPAIGASMIGEARRYMQEFLRTPLKASSILDARFTFVDATLASFYGLTRTGAANATDFVKVDTSSTQREGLLTLGSFLTTTSYPNRTSPVRRGEYVFRRLLCDTVSDPPPDIPQLNETPRPGQTLRERMEEHRANPACSPCHNLMDPIGFGLENFDAIGSYRTMDSGVAVDSSGQLPGGMPFNGAAQLGAILASDVRVPGCVTEKFMTFAVGRLLDQQDDPQWIAYLSGHAQATDGSLTSIIRTVVQSDAFRSRRPGVRM